MWQRFWLGGLLVLGGLATPVHGQVKLEWKFKEGDKFYLESVNTTKHTMKIGGRVNNQDVENTTVDSYEVVKTDADQIVLKKTVESVDAKTSGLGAEEAASAAKKMKGAVFMVTVDPRRSVVTKVEGVEEYVKKITGGNPLQQQAMSLSVNEATVREDVQNILVGFLPEKPAEKGETWTRKAKLSMGPIGSFDTTGQYTYRGKSKLDGKPVDKIDVKWTFTYVPPKDKGGFPFEISKGDLKTDSATGTYYFDADGGKLVQMDRKYRIKGTLTIKSMDQQLLMEIDQDATSKTRLLDKAPESK
jgi:hypothetical protein